MQAATFRNWCFRQEVIHNCPEKSYSEEDGKLLECTIFEIFRFSEKLFKQNFYIVELQASLGLGPSGVSTMKVFCKTS